MPSVKPASPPPPPPPRQRIQRRGTATTTGVGRDLAGTAGAVDERGIRRCALPVRATSPRLCRTISAGDSTTDQALCCRTYSIGRRCRVRPSSRGAPSPRPAVEPPRYGRCLLIDDGHGGSQG